MSDPTVFYIHKQDLQKVIDGCDLGDFVKAHVCVYPHRDDMKDLVRLEVQPLDKPAWPTEADVNEWVGENVWGSEEEKCERLVREFHRWLTQHAAPRTWDRIPTAADYPGMTDAPAKEKE